MKKKALVTLTMCLLLLPIAAKGQNNFVEGRNNNFVGIAGELFLSPDDFVAIGYTGVFLEMMLSRSIGIETGYFIKNTGDADGSFNTIPVGIKYYTNFLNLTGGFTLNFVMDYEDRHEMDPPLEFGTFLRLSRDIPLNDRLIFEPGLSSQFQLYMLYFYIGLSLRLKYRL